MSLSTPIETTVYHVGAAGGVHRSWAAYPGRLRYVCFDAEEGAAAELKRIVSATGDAGRVRMFTETRPVLDRSGEVDFHVYDDEPMLSSVYVLDAKVTHRFRYQDLTGVRTVRMRCATIDDIAASRGEAPDSLTIDAQGAGLPVLKGAAKALASSIVGARVEVEFLPLYINQPLFDELWSYMRGCGFRLARLEKCGSGETGISTDAGPFSSTIGDGVPAWADAIFIKTPSLGNWAEASAAHRASFLFKYVLFALNNGIGSVGLDLAFEIGKRNLLGQTLAALCEPDRALLVRELLAHLERCEACAWENQADRLAVFRREQRAFREMLDTLLGQAP